LSYTKFVDGKNFNCAVLNRAKDYVWNFQLASFHAWRILLFVSGFCFVVETEFQNAGPSHFKRKKFVIYFIVH